MSYEAWGEPDDSPYEAAIEAGWLDPTDLSKALIDVMNERDRQWNEEGWTPEHDDKHVHGELAQAAVCYAIGGSEKHWPWDKAWFKRTTRRRDLVKAAALLLAEIERIDRAVAAGA